MPALHTVSTRLENDISQSLLWNDAAHKVRRFHLQIPAHLHAATLNNVVLADDRRLDIARARLHQRAHDGIFDETTRELVPGDHKNTTFTM